MKVIGCACIASVFASIHAAFPQPAGVRLVLAARLADHPQGVLIPSVSEHRPMPSVFQERENGEGDALLVSRGLNNIMGIAQDAPACHSRIRGGFYSWSVFDHRGLSLTTVVRLRKNCVGRAFSMETARSISGRSLEKCSLVGPNLPGSRESAQVFADHPECRA